MSELVTDEAVEVLAKRHYDAMVAADKYPENWVSWELLTESEHPVNETLRGSILSGARADLEAVAPLIAARALELDAAQRAAESEPCDAEVWSLDYFAGQNIDPYWIRCTHLGPHDEHEDAGNTGAHWKEARA